MRLTNTPFRQPMLSFAASRTYLLVALAAIIWWSLYNSIEPLSAWLNYQALGLSHDSQLGESLAFFLYDVPKILLLLSGMVFIVSWIRTFFSPERTRALLGGKREGIGNVLAAVLGIVTPFCSCSAVPLFIGFVESGIPLGVTFSFLIAAPTINEVAVVLLYGLFGWQVAALYIGSGLVIAITAGTIIGRLKLERFVEDFVWNLQSGGASPVEQLSGSQRIERAAHAVREIVGKVWLYVILGIAVGAGIHGYVPESALAGIMGIQSGCISVEGRGIGRFPELIEALAHDGSANRQQAFKVRTTPLHAGTVEALTELLATAFDHATTYREAVFTQFPVLHAPLVRLEITRLTP